MRLAKSYYIVVVVPIVLDERKLFLFLPEAINFNKEIFVRDEVMRSVNLYRYFAD